MFSSAQDEELFNRMSINALPQKKTDVGSLSPRRRPYNEFPRLLAWYLHTSHKPTVPGRHGGHHQSSAFWENSGYLST